MNTTPLDIFPLGLLFLILCAVACLVLEGGYRLGRWRHSRNADEKETPVGAMVASILALFAFMLAFVFGLAADRFEKRRQTILDEANAIGTTYLRARQLPEPQRAESTRLLREYVDVRVRADWARDSSRHKGPSPGSPCRGHPSKRRTLRGGRARRGGAHGRPQPFPADAALPNR